MRKSHFVVACCCLGVVLSALLPCGVLLWGESLAGRPFSLPAITYRSPVKPVTEKPSSGLEQILFVLEKGARRPVTTMEIGTTEMDAFALVDALREEITELQNRNVLPNAVGYFPQSAVLARWSLPEGEQADLWEFTIFMEGETILLRYHSDSGRVLSVERALREEMPSSLPEKVREGWSSYLEISVLPGSPQVRVEGNTLFFSISPL